MTTDKLILGAITGDIIGSVYEFNSEKAQMVTIVKQLKSEISRHISLLQFYIFRFNPEFSFERVGTSLNG